EPPQQLPVQVGPVAPALVEHLQGPVWPLVASHAPGGGFLTLLSGLPATGPVWGAGVWASHIMDVSTVSGPGIDALMPSLIRRPVPNSNVATAANILRMEVTPSCIMCQENTVHYVTLLRAWGHRVATFSSRSRLGGVIREFGQSVSRYSLVPLPQ